METDGGIPWLGGPITLHAWRTYECTLDTKAECEYQEGYWRFWYEADHRYALPTIALFMAVILLFSLANLASVFSLHRTQTPWISKTKASFRFLSYRSYRIRALDWNSAPVGVLLLAGVGVIFFFSMTLAPKPYYWQSSIYGSSPPIATRAGWMALGCMPFVFATAGKSSFITLVTGVAHEKLQVFHRWTSYTFFVLSLIHTFPFIIHNIEVGEMEMQWKMSVFYWTGAVALVAQAWLTFASWGPIRNLCYEWFKFSHFVAALIFMLFLFFHCDYTLSSWDYFIATGVLFAGSWLHRQSRIYFEHGIKHRASLSLSSNGFVQVSVPTKARWRVGQHFFVRFMSLGMHAWTIHPFTACSLPNWRRSDDSPSELVFFIRSRGGFTSRLARYIETHPNSSMRVLLDGPYGGVNMQRIQDSPRMLVIAGGSGAGWTLPFVSVFLRKLFVADKKDSAASRPSLKVILATRDVPTRHWYESEIRELLASASKEQRSAIEIEIYYTGTWDNVEDSKAAGQFLQRLDEPEKAPDVTPARELYDISDSSSQECSQPLREIRHLASRPDLPAIVQQEASLVSSDTSLGVFVSHDDDM